MNETSTFPDTFLDYIPDPPMGREAYREALKWSYERDEVGADPIYALLKVTNRCASRCVYCGHAGTGDESQEPSTELLKTVLDQIAEAGSVSVNFTGGEPLQRQDLPALIRHACGLGLFTVLLTNGMLLRKRSDELYRTGLGMVIVSVDSVRPEIYRATRGVALEPVLDGLDAILAWPENDRPVVTATVVVTSENLGHLHEIVGHFARRGVGVKLTPYHHHGRWEDDTLSPRDSAAYQDATDRLLSLKAAGEGVINSRRYLENFAAFNFKERSLPAHYRCYCGYTTLSIDPMMNVRSCWSVGLPVVGNLRRRSLKDLLASEKMRAMRRRIRKLRCERCWLLCTAEISLRFQ